MKIKIAPRMHSKIWGIYQHLLELQADGKGGDTMIICYPNAPFHCEEKQSLWELDGIPQVYYYQQKVYDYPVKTVNEWIELYNEQGYFVK